MKITTKEELRKMLSENKISEEEYKEELEELSEEEESVSKELVLLEKQSESLATIAKAVSEIGFKEDGKEEIQILLKAILTMQKNQEAIVNAMMKKKFEIALPEVEREWTITVMKRDYYGHLEVAKLTEKRI